MIFFSFSAVSIVLRRALLTSPMVDVNFDQFLYGIHTVEKRPLYFNLKFNRNSFGKNILI
jgi:hypothetical protein